MNDNFVTDTMALVLRLEKRKMGKRAKAIYQNAEKGNVKILIPAMVLAEIGYLSERNKVDTNLNEVRDYCQKYSSIQVEPITEEIIHESFEIEDIPELHDRMIAGTAYLKNLEVITNDPMIINSEYVSTIW